MNLFDNKLISSLNTIDIKKLSLKEIKLFNKKKDINNRCFWNNRNKSFVFF